jgi:hypothetical protein
MVDKEITQVADDALAKIEEIKKAAGEFRENVASLVKDMHVEANNWHFNVENQENGVIVDIGIKLLISKKK